MERHPNIPISAWAYLVELSEHPRIEALILFGSRAFGDHGERSDVDVAVVGQRLTFEDWALIRDSAYHARTLYWISLIHLNRNPPKLRDRVAKTGITIYEKKTS